jgi:ATP-dependent exoDNAse (exonuclease V) alpha subunit
MKKDLKLILSKNLQMFDNSNVEVMNAVKLIAERNNVFITGEGGTGKSHFITTLCKILFDNNIIVRIVTPTGTSAVNLNESLIAAGCPPIASTYHSLYGFRPNREDNVLGKVAVSTINAIDILIIDEVSMIPPTEFDRISFRHNEPHKDTSELKDRLLSNLFTKEDLFNKGFENVQVLLFGDLFQLPPVMDYNVKDFGYSSEYIFDSVTYKEGNYKTVAFFKNYRVASQADEVSKFKADLLRKLLTEVRYNCLSPITLKTLNMLNTHRIINKKDITKKLLETDAILLSPYNKECIKNNNDVKELINTKVIDLIPTCSNYLNKQIAKLDIKKRNELFNKHFSIDYENNIKIGQRVLVTTNMPKLGIFNGDMGIVDSGVYFQNELQAIKIVIKRKQGDIAYEIPRLLYTKPTSAEINTLTTSITFNKGKSQETIIKQTVALWTEQFPLKDAFAITIHNCQGKTFNHTIIDLDNKKSKYINAKHKGFNKGMFYVALSRNTNLDNIFLTDLILRSHINADDYVLKFYLDNDLLEEYMVEPIKEKLCKSTQP